jgi:hypothetical protein
MIDTINEACHLFRFATRLLMLKLAGNLSASQGQAIRRDDSNRAVVADSFGDLDRDSGVLWAATVDCAQEGRAGWIGIMGF